MIIITKELNVGIIVFVAIFDIRSETGKAKLPVQKADASEGMKIPADFPEQGMLTAAALQLRADVRGNNKPAGKRMGYTAADTDGMTALEVHTGKIQVQA